MNEYILSGLNCYIYEWVMVLEHLLSIHSENLPMYKLYYKVLKFIGIFQYDIMVYYMTVFWFAPYHYPDVPLKVDWCPQIVLMLASRFVNWLSNIILSLPGICLKPPYCKENCDIFMLPSTVVAEGIYCFPFVCLSMHQSFRLDPLNNLKDFNQIVHRHSLIDIQ